MKNIHSHYYHTSCNSASTEDVPFQNFVVSCRTYLWTIPLYVRDYQSLYFGRNVSKIVFNIIVYLHWFQLREQCTFEWNTYTAECTRTHRLPSKLKVCKFSSSLVNFWSTVFTSIADRQICHAILRKNPEKLVETVVLAHTFAVIRRTRRKVNMQHFLSEIYTPE